MDDEAELYIFRPEPDPDWQAERAAQRHEARRRMSLRLAEVLAVADAFADEPARRVAAVLDGLFVHPDIESGEPCPCSCHPRIPESDHHDYGDACGCRRTSVQRKAVWAQIWAERDAYWRSPEGLEITAAREAEEAELQAWVAADPGVRIGRHGGLCPEQWWGSVDGHSFYFRERHERWRIELDLVPNGRFVEVWTGDEDKPEFTEFADGEVIACGDIEVDGYGETPLQRARFIVEAIRTQLLRRTCTVHTTQRDGIELALGMSMDWCPACGIRQA